MAWKIDRQTTQSVQGIFEGYHPVVKRDGGQVLIDRSPFGRLTVIPLVQGTALVAAEKPPAEAPQFDPALLSAEVLGHLRRNRLRPWRIVPADEVANVLRDLAEGPEETEADTGEPNWSPYIRVPAAPERIVGEARVLAGERLAGLLQACGPGCPLPALIGPAGVGRHAVSVAVSARRLGLDPVELPLGRLMIDRVFQTPLELLLETLLAAGAYMQEQQLLLVSGAERLAALPGDPRHQVLDELSRLPRVALLAEGPFARMAAIDGVVPLLCPGLESLTEARELLAAEEPDLKLMGSALPTACRSARQGGVGILPGRLLFLVRVGRYLPNPGTPGSTFSPDEAHPAAEVAREAWTGDAEDDTEGDAGL